MNTSDAILLEESRGITDRLFDWIEGSLWKQLAFYLTTLVLVTGIGVVVGSNGDFSKFRFSKDLLSPLALALIFDLAVGQLAKSRKVDKRLRLSNLSYRSNNDELASKNKSLSDAISELQATLASYDVLHSDMSTVVGSLKIDRQEFYDRLLKSKFAGAISPFLFRKNAGRHSYTYRSRDQNVIRKQYLDDLRRFIKATKSTYFTFQPGLPWFAENYWFFKSFDESVDCTRIVTFEKVEEVVDTANKANELRSYAFESGNRTTTLWGNKKECLDLLRKNLSKEAYELLKNENEMPFDLETAIEKGDLVVCDNRAVVTFSESKVRNEYRGEIQFHLLDDACANAIKELTDFFSRNSAVELEANDRRISTTPGIFRLKELEVAKQSVGSRQYTHKDLRVDLSILGPNADAIARYLDKHGETRWVLKANSYGMGADRIAPFLFSKGFRKFAFESIPESIKAKQAISDDLDSDGAPQIDDLDLLIMEPIQSDEIGSLIGMNASCFVWTRKQLEDLDEIYKNSGDLKAKVHLKANLGLNRFGVKPLSDFLGIFQFAWSLEHVEVVGIAGHHHECVPNEQTLKWQREFESVVTECNGWFVEQGFNQSKFPVVHSRSTGSLPVGQPNNLPWKEEFRVGGALYGVFPNPNVRNHYRANGLAVEKAVSLKGRVEAFVPVEPGETISYGNSKFESTTSGVIGWVNLGYSDGLPPVMKGQTLIHYRGIPCKILGDVGMNYTAIDITRPFNDKLTETEQELRLKECHTNSEDDVIVLDSELEVETLANSCNRPSYSVLTSFGAAELHKHVGELTRT